MFKKPAVNKSFFLNHLVTFKINKKPLLKLKMIEENKENWVETFQKQYLD